MDMIEEPLQHIPSQELLMGQKPEIYRENYVIDYLQPEDEAVMVNLIRRNLDHFEEAGSVLAAAFRRLDNLYTNYNKEGAAFFMVKDQTTNKCIGGAGLGPLAGLPHAEGIGELRELVIDKNFRNKGIGGKLLAHCLKEAKVRGYKRLYLETTPEMENAQKLFRRFYFRPVEQKQSPQKAASEGSSIPCYFMLEDLGSLEV